MYYLFMTEDFSYWDVWPTIWSFMELEMIQSALLEHDEKPDLFNAVGNITVNMKGGIMSFGVIMRFLTCNCLTDIHSSKWK